MEHFYLRESLKIVSFAKVNALRRIYKSLRKNLKFSASNPETFKEVWSFNSNGIRVISLLLILIFSLGLLIAYLFGPSNYFNKNDVSIERDNLEKQSEQIIALTEKIKSQEDYINNIKRILKGEIPVNSNLDTITKEVKSIDIDKMKTHETESESDLAKKVKDDMLTGLDNQKDKAIAYFGSPVIGVISQEFDLKTHPGIDVVTEKDQAVKACLAGTVVYSGYSRQDGYIIIINHSDKFISVYKHNKRVLKKAGTKVQLGDPIGIVGNTGENTDGPHLHFELWYDQSPVNPKNYIKFTR